MAAMPEDFDYHIIFSYACAQFYYISFGLTLKMYILLQILLSWSPPRKNMMIILSKLNFFVINNINNGLKTIKFLHLTAPSNICHFYHLFFAQLHMNENAK